MESEISEALSKVDFSENVEFMPDSDASPEKRTSSTPLREKVRLIIFEADTLAGKLFDVALIGCILLSVAAVILVSVEDIRVDWSRELLMIEWGFTLIFTIEYLLRLWSVKTPRLYATSFFGLVDLIAILPTYLSLFVSGAETLIVIRMLRVLRVFRVLKLLHYMAGATTIMRALRASRFKVFVFMFTMLVLVTIIGAVMYLVEGLSGNEGFSSIPAGIYWAVVTLTTVGYGDVVPVTPLGKFITAFVVLLGYAIIAVPTGIMTAEFAKYKDDELPNTHACSNCGTESHREDATYCWRCGHSLNP